MQSLFERRSLVSVGDFARPMRPGKAMCAFFDSLPRILAGNDFMELVKHIRTARFPGGRFLARSSAKGVRKNTTRRSEVVFALGGHVVKCGLSPTIIDLVRRGFVSAIAMNGATAIHDLEIALAGHTSEDVAESIKDGSFGMARETAETFAAACGLASAQRIGLGEALGRTIADDRCRHRKFSILSAGLECGIPVTVHVAVGTDIVHMYPPLSGRELGEATLEDFKRVAAVVAKLDNGVWVNVGSAIVLPEVFLKAVSLARNQGYALKNITAANLDMIQHYRPRVNVVGRPVARGISLTGHHEILLPLLHAALISSV
jgi:hypothetical protein